MRTVSGPILQSVGKNKEDCIITCATLVLMCHMCYVFWGLKEKPLRVSLFQSMIHYLYCLKLYIVLSQQHTNCD